MSGGIRKGDNNVDPFSLTRLPYEGLMELNYYWSLDFFFYIKKFTYGASISHFIVLNSSPCCNFFSLYLI